MKVQLEAKLKELQDGLAKANASVAQAAANVNAFTGAIQVVQQLLQEATKEQAPPPAKKVRSIATATPSTN